jgi:tetratricopeptide (TPR) repeat protein
LHDLQEQRGRPDEGARMTSQLLRRSPSSFSGQAAMAEAWLAATDFERAGAWLQFMLRDRPDSDSTRLLEAKRLIALGAYQDAIDMLTSVTVNDETVWRLQVLGTLACLGLERLECARQEVRAYQNLLRENNLRGDGNPLFDAYAAVLSLLVEEQLAGEAQPAQTWLDLLATLDTSTSRRRFADAYYLRTGILVRAGRREEALQTLSQAISGPGGAVKSLDAYGLTPETSLLLEPLRGSPEFADWYADYEVRRDAMQARMVNLEVRGEIILPETVERLVLR